MPKGLCPIDGCRFAKSEETHLCPTHWDHVPDELKRKVLHEARRSPNSHAHMEATCQAISWTRILVGRLQMLEAADLLDGAVRNLTDTRFPMTAPSSTVTLLREVAASLGQVQQQDLDFYLKLCGR